MAAKSDPVRVTVEGTVRKAASGKLTTGVDISASDADPNHLKGSATADVKAVLAVRGSAPDQVVAGGSLTYRWSVTDTSTAAAREVELSMPLPPAGQATFVSASHGVTPQQNELRWPLGTIAPKASRDAVAEFRLTHYAPIGALNGVAATAKGANADSVTSAAVAPTVGAGTHLDLTASVSPAEAAPGDTVVFTWTLANSGLSDAADLRIDVPVPNGVLAKTAVLAGPTGTVPTGQPVPVAALAPGHPVKITLTGEIGLQDQGVVATTATVAEGGHPTGLAATASVSVTPSAKLTLTPKAGPVTTAAGTRADLVWTVAKTGRGAVRDAYVFVDPPPGLDVVALRIGTRSAAQVADGARVSGQLDDPGDVPITVTATVAVDAGFGGDDATVRAWLSPEAAPPKTTPSETTVAVTRSSAITLWHQDSQPTPLVAGRRGTLFWDIANAGPSDAAGLTAAVTLPATVEPGDATVNTHPAELVRQGTSWQVAVDAVAAEESAQVCVTVSVPASDTGTTVAAPVTVTGTGLTTTTQGGSDHPLTRESALTATTTAAPDRAQTGSDATYTWQLSNKGPSTAAKVVYEATFTPAGTSITVDPVDGGVSAKQGNATVVTWTVDLEPARHKDFSAIVTFGAEAGSLQVDSTSRLDGKRTTSTQSTTAVTTPALVPSGLPAAAPGA
ncbi:MAG: hypothetical protein HOV94_00765 [Saccharothrix sp.]|nr:hypothetical protein [Saccharothrix sp.]